MPQPFEQFNMPDLQNWDKQQFRQEAKKMNMSDKIGDLAHFLVQNFRNELSAEEHVVDTAIRLLQPLQPLLNSAPNDADTNTTKS